MQCDPNNYIDGLNSNLGLIQSSQETTLNSTFLPIGADDGSNNTTNSISKIMEITDINERRKALHKLTFGEDDDEDKDDKTNNKKTIDKNQTNEINSSRFEILSDKSDQVGKRKITPPTSSNDKKNSSDVYDSDEDQTTIEKKNKRNRDEDDELELFKDKNKDSTNDDNTDLTIVPPPTSRFDDLEVTDEFNDSEVVIDKDSKTIQDFHHKKISFDELFAKKTNVNTGGVQYFRLPIPETGFEVNQNEMEPETMIRSYFPWYPFSQQFYEELSISAIIKCYEEKFVEIDICERLQAALLQDFQQNNRNIDHHSDGIIMRKHVKGQDEIKQEREIYYTDPTTLKYEKMNEVEAAIQKIYKNNSVLFARYMNRMRRVARRLVCRILDKDDSKLPSPLRAALEYLDKTKNKKIYIEQNMSTFEISCFANGLLRMLLSYEIDDVSTSHLLILYSFTTAMVSSVLPLHHTFSNVFFSFI